MRGEGRLSGIGEAEPGALAAALRRLADSKIAGLLQRVAAEFQRDAALAADVRRRDLEVDQMYNALFREFLTYMMEDPRNITPCTHLLFMAKNMERIGDHATNIAETVHYEITGDDILGERPRAQPTAEDSDPTPNLSTH